MLGIVKYPRTTHLVGSALQTGDDRDRLSMNALRGRGTLRFEEKIDGANSAISFDPETGDMVLQSRGHALTGGGRERQFDMLKTWAAVHEQAFRSILGQRYVMYGEWTAAVHSLYYDLLPHFFHEFDVFDRERNVFLSTPARRRLLEGSPVTSVPIVHEGWIADRDLHALVKPSLYRSADWRDNLFKAALASGLDPQRFSSEIDGDDLSEGLYLKHEYDDLGIVVGRYKYVRASFVQRIVDAGVHWSARPIVFNELAPGVDIFATPGVGLQP